MELLSQLVYFLWIIINYTCGQTRLCHKLFPPIRSKNDETLLRGKYTVEHCVPKILQFSFSVVGMFVRRLRKHDFNTTQLKFSVFADQNGYRYKTHVQITRSREWQYRVLGWRKVIYKGNFRGLTPKIFVRILLFSYEFIYKTNWYTLDASYVCYNYSQKRAFGGGVWL